MFVLKITNQSIALLLYWLLAFTCPGTSLTVLETFLKKMEKRDKEKKKKREDMAILTNDNIFIVKNYTTSLKMLETIFCWTFYCTTKLNAHCSVGLPTL